MSRYALSVSIHQQLLNHCLETASQEVCGLIGVDVNGRQALYRVDNIATEPATAFLMEPHSQIDAMRAMRESSQELQAIYHSHPNSEALPSETDLKLANYPGAIYLIASLQSDTPVVRAFEITNESYAELQLELI